MATRSSELSAFSGPDHLFTRLSSSADSLPELSSGLVRECLILYPENHIHLRDLRYQSGLLWATILPHEIDYSMITVDYYTATQIVMITSQMAYVLGGCAILDPQFRGLGPKLYASYLQLLNRGELYYARMNMKLKKKTSNKSPIRTSMQVKRIVKRNNMHLMLSHMELGQGNTEVDIMLVMDSRRLF